MDTSTVRAIVETHLDSLCQKLGIGHWHIVVRYEPSSCEDNRYEIGRCTWLVDYNKATITLNPEGFDTEAEVLKTLRHECFHILISPFSVAHSVIEEALKDHPQRMAMIESIWTHSMEKTIINLERMHHGLSKHNSEKRPDASRDQAQPQPKAKTRRA